MVAEQGNVIGAGFVVIVDQPMSVGVAGLLQSYLHCFDIHLLYESVVALPLADRAAA